MVLCIEFQFQSVEAEIKELATSHMTDPDKVLGSQDADNEG